MRTLVRLLIVLLLLPVVYLAWTAAEIWQTSKRDQRSGADAIVVMGAAQYDGRPSPVFRARLDHAQTLEREGLAPLIVVLGGKQAGDRYTEAQAGAAYLEESLPASRVTGVGEGRNTLESLRSFQGLAEDRNLRRILIVSDPLHLARSKEMAEDLGFEVEVSAPPTEPSGGAVLALARETLVLTYYRFFEA